MIKTYGEFEVNDTGKTLSYLEAVKLCNNGWRFMDANELFVIYEQGFRKGDYFWLHVEGIDNQKFRPVGVGGGNFGNYVDASGSSFVGIGRSRAVVLVKKTGGKKGGR